MVLDWAVYSIPNGRTLGWEVYGRDGGGGRLLYMYLMLNA